jgi:hypothetical protein
VPKVHNKPIKRPIKGSNKKSKRLPKCALVWRPGLSGAPPDSVQCTREPDSKLATFGNSGSPGLAHRTVSGAPVERKNKTLLDMARTMLDEYKTSDRFWAEAVNTACYAINRLYLQTCHLICL